LVGSAKPKFVAFLGSRGAIRQLIEGPWRTQGAAVGFKPTVRFPHAIA
jgi:hypothetical protein